MKKRIISLTVILTMGLSMAGCQASAGGSSSSAASSVSSVSPSSAPSSTLQAASSSAAAGSSAAASRAIEEYHPEPDMAEYSDGLYGVWVSAREEKEAAMEDCKALKDKGFDAAILYSPDWENLNSKPFYCVTAGKCKSEDKAKELLSKVKAAGYKDAYIKSSGKRQSYRVRYIISGLDPYEVTSDKVYIHNVTVMEFTNDDMRTATLICDKDTVFDKDCEMEFFKFYKPGQNVFEWLKSTLSSNSTDSEEVYMAVAGVFEVSVTGNHIDRVYGIYWWD